MKRYPKHVLSAAWRNRRKYVPEQRGKSGHRWSKAEAILHAPRGAQANLETRHVFTDEERERAKARQKDVTVREKRRLSRERFMDEKCKSDPNVEWIG